MTTCTISPEMLAQAERFANDPVVAEYLKTRNTWSATFRPRPDDPANYDQQYSFVHQRDPVSMLVGGNAAGTTTAAAAKTALFLLEQQPPPRKDAPFWIIAPTFEQSCDVCWSEKLLGNGFIPECEFDWRNVSWHDARKARPSTVPLKPWPVERGGDPNKNWRIEFKSYEQGRASMQAKSIGGFWFSEQFPQDLFIEVLRGCREYMFPGGQFAEFTPIDPELTVWVEQMMEKPPKGWKFYRANTSLNRGNLAAGWFDQFFGTVSDEMRAVRETGALANFENAIYPSFNREVHIVDESEVIIPPGAWHFMGTDWGASVEHPFVTVFGYRDAMGNWQIYDEHWSTDQNMITVDHANAILDIAASHGWPVEDDPDQEFSRSGRRIASEANPLWGCNYADPSRPGEINAFNSYGIPTMGGVNNVFNGILYIRDLLKVQPSGMPRLLISSRCKHLCEEMRKYRWKRGRKPGQVGQLNPTVAKPEPLKRDDDTVDAMRYLVYTADYQGGEAPLSGRSSSEGSRNPAVQLQRAAERRIQIAASRGYFG